ncbi:MAG TPA: hypothetical protein VH678_19370 [Xanthobacteraceae bacterium]|jgi:hypothetical protein
MPRLKFLAGCLALLTTTLPASAQSNGTGAAGQLSVPSAQNSGAGLPGQHDTQSGPAAKPMEPGMNVTKGHNETVREQDAAKIPGLPGNKSGPAVHPQSGSMSGQAPVQNGLRSVQQKVRQNLEQAGFTDIQLMPSSFLVRAKDRDGNPVMMVINPDSITEMTINGQGAGKGAGKTTGQGAQTQPNAPSGAPR